MAGQSSSHFRALMKKNWIIWKRNKCCSTLEIVVPLIFNLFLILIRTSISPKEFEEQSYYNSEEGVTKLYSDPLLMSGYNVDGKDLFGIQDTPDFEKYMSLLKANSMKLCYCDPEDQDDCRPGVAGLSPSDSSIIKKVADKIEKLGIQVKYFDSNDEIDDYVTAHEYKDGPYLCFAVSLDISDSGKYSYQLRFNSTQQEEMINPKMQRLNPVLEKDFDNSKKYIDSGFLTLQNWMDSEILRKETGNADAQLKPKISSMRIEKHEHDSFAQDIRGVVAFFTVMPLILILINFVSKLLYEKEKRIREGMKMMGMSSTSFYSSWMLTYLIVVFVISLLEATLQKLVAFKHSNFFILFILYFIFGICLIIQGYFIQVFFSRVMIGMIISMVYFLLQYMLVEFATDNDESYKSKGTKTGLSFFPPVAISTALNNMLEYETGQTGVSWSEFTQDFQNYNVAISIWMMILHGAIFLILALYLDQVFPNEFGTKKHPLFFLGFKKGDKTQGMEKKNSIQHKQSEESNQFKDEVEVVDAQFRQQELNKQTVTIEKLKKIFSNGTKAVNGISLSMYKDQISVLLGHNGAGKTTTISMLTGLIEVTDGNAQVFDKNIKNDMEDIRQFLGLCPQHDILFDKLTVREHLELFATFKGLTGSAVEEQVKRLVKELDLEEKENQQSRTLSGGQKRRLSVGIAFIGDSKFVVLDEPTSGMDTSARRFIWDLLKNYRQGRIILLTTHFMDEADYLGDRITIMSGGKVKASGSPMFLKNKFGVGYNLVIVKKTQQPNQKLINKVKEFIPTAKLLSDVSSEITFQLPMESKKTFEQLFEFFDQHLDDYDIQTYGISITTLEEVFLKIAELEASEKDREEALKMKMSLKKSMTESKMKRSEGENIGLDQEIHFNRGTITIFFQHLFALLKKRINYFKRDKKGLLCEFFLPCIMIIIGLAIMTRKLINNPDPLKIEPLMYDDYPLKYIYSPTNPETSAIFNKFSTDGFTKEAYGTNSIAEWDMEVFRQKSRTLLGAYYLNSIDHTTNQYDYYVECETIAPESGILYLNKINEAIISQASGKDIEITLYQSPMKITEKWEKLNNTINGMMASFYFTIAMAFIPASVIVFLVKEKVINAKHQQRVSGVTYVSYWFSNLVVDYSKYLLPCIFAPIMALAFDVEALTKAKEKRFSAFCLLNIFFGFALANFTYLFTFIFVNHGTAQLSMFFISFAFGAIFVMGIFILKLIESTRNVGKGLQWIFRLFPPFTYGFGLMNIANVELYGMIEDDLDGVDVYHIDIAGADILFLALEAFLYFILVLFLEKIKSHKIFSKMENKLNFVKESEYEQVGKIDSDVKREIEEIEKTDAANYALKVDKLRKIYPTGKIAVQQISFGIQNGDCFSLLGVNGAGKTTTFKMLCGEFAPTSGNAFINGYSVVDQLSEAQKLIGYCPQFDALLELVTVREHLELYANIKGMVKEEIPSQIDSIIKEMQLQKFENICAGKLSGGNKRKLSVAIAMIGNPPIIFLDEPSTGMDPGARRFMWNVISRISTLRKKSSVVLTTHSMEEAEALSTKLGIMVDGEFKCMGSVQHIKNKFGKGYEIELKVDVSQAQIDETLHQLNYQNDHICTTIGECESILQKLGKAEYINMIKPQDAGSPLHFQLTSQKQLGIQLLIEFYLIETKGEKIKQFLQQNFEKFFLIEHYGSYFRFKLDSTISVGKLFGKFEKEQTQLELANYSIKQATIEQIFNLFAEGKIEYEDSETSSPNQKLMMDQKLSNQSPQVEILLNDSDSQRIQIKPNQKAT